MFTRLRPDKHIRGRVRGYNIVPFNGDFPRSKQGHMFRHADEYWYAQTPWKSNLVVYEWGAIVSRLLGLGAARYRIAGMLLEFENVSSPGDPVSAPTLGRTRDITYYDDLASSGTRDYIRAAMTAHTISSSDESLYPNGNIVNFIARSQGVQGVHGKTFSNAANSVIFGGALIAMVDNNDSTQDLILSAFYFDVESQQPKLSTSQVGLEWELELQ